MMTCPACELPIRPGQPVALARIGDEGDGRTVVLHLHPCAGMLLVLLVGAC